MAKLKLKPVGDKVIVQPLTEENTTKSGIVLPDTVSKERPQQGKIIAVGEGKVSDEGKVIPMKLTVGQKVLFTKYAPSEFELDGEEYLVMSESDILAIIE